MLYPLVSRCTSSEHFILPHSHIHFPIPSFEEYITTGTNMKAFSMFLALVFVQLSSVLAQTCSGIFNAYFMLASPNVHQHRLVARLTQNVKNSTVGKATASSRINRPLRRITLVSTLP